MAKPVKYSSILQDFIEPLLEEDDSNEILLRKFKFAEIVWNYCIAKEFKLPALSELDKCLFELDKEDKEMLTLFREFVRRKETNFKKYKNFITKIEFRTNPGEACRVYVESIDPKAISQGDL
ncbi:MAG: hypothetical protein ABI378_05045 [Chitinophagaceae bacterium]